MKPTKTINTNNENVKLLSNCCGAEVKVDCADDFSTGDSEKYGGTCCYICSKCHKPCDTQEYKVVVGVTWTKEDVAKITPNKQTESIEPKFIKSFDKNLYKTSGIDKMEYYNATPLPHEPAVTDSIDWQERVRTFCGLYGMEKSRINELVIGLENDLQSLIDASYKRGYEKGSENIEVYQDILTSIIERDAR